MVAGTTSAITTRSVDRVLALSVHTVPCCCVTPSGLRSRRGRASTLARRTCLIVRVADTQGPTMEEVSLEGSVG